MAEPPAAQPPGGKARMLAEVHAGLSRPQKELSPKFFYDEWGSRLFEEITQLPEYYLTRTERALLETEVPGLIARLGPRTLVELGAGSAAKTRIILDAMRARDGPGTYVPVDVSSDFLQEVAAQLRQEYPDFQVVPLEADITASLRLPPGLARPALFAFLGSTIGNFPGAAAVRLLHRVRACMEPDDRFLLGVDLKKDRARLEAAYNDSRGVTAEFSLNVLRVLNRELGADFDLDAFVHYAFYDAEAGRIEMHLVARGDQVVTIPGLEPVHFRDGESVRTAVSCKFDRADVSHLFEAAHMELDGWLTDPDNLFALALGRPTETA
jgi:L-histidine Nalpha-methyltransferase